MGKNFKDLYRHINVRMSKLDEKTFFDFLMMNGPLKQNRPVSPMSSGARSSSTANDDIGHFNNRAIFNLKQLDKLIDFFCKENFEKTLEK